MWEKIHSFNEIIEKTKHTGPSTLIVFDVMNVLICQTDLVLRPSGLPFFRQYIKTLQETHTQLIQGKTRMMPLAEYLEGKIIENLVNISNRLLDEEMPGFISGLIGKGVKVIALSAGKAKRYADFESLADCRIDQLKKMGIDFSASFIGKKSIHLTTQQTESNNTVLFKDGVILTEGHSKGEVLNAFLDTVDWKPNEVIMFEDQQKWFQDMEKHMSTRKISFQGFHLLHHAFNADRPNQKLFDFQFSYLKEHHMWLNDEQALPLLAQNEKASNHLTSSIKKMVLIFLDIDGVLLNLSFTNPIASTFISAIKAGDTSTLAEKGVAHFDKDALQSLNILISNIESKNYHCGIIITSSWRENLSLASLKLLFKDHKFSEHIIDKTACKIKLNSPAYKFKRGEMIETWLSTSANNLAIADFLIIDDIDDSISELFPDQFVHCKQGVFCEEDLKKGMQLLEIKNRTSIDTPTITLSASVIRDETSNSTPIETTLSIRISRELHQKMSTTPTLTWTKEHNNAMLLEKWKKEYHEKFQNKEENGYGPLAIVLYKK